MSNNNFYYTVNEINNYNTLSDESKKEFILKYTDETIYTKQYLIDNNFNIHLSYIVLRILDAYPNKKIVLHITACRKCDSYINIQTECLKPTTKRRG